MKTAIYTLAAVIIVIAAISIFPNNRNVSMPSHTPTPEIKVSGSFGESLNSTTTDSTWNTVNKKRLKYGSGVLGSVVITNATVGSAITLYDATSTTDLTQKTIATFGATAPASSYDFSVAFNNGLVVEVTSGNAGSTTITWK